MMDAAKLRRNDVFSLMICLLTILATAGCERTATTRAPELQTAQTEGESAADRLAEIEEEAPLLLLEDEPVLLLDDAAGEAASSPGADNSRCFVCHVNYMQETIAVTHARMNIGCAACHGDSDAHIADESWASGGNGTPPETMYTRDQINPSCMGCHPKDKIDTPQHAPLFAAADENKVCTDCHGNHRLPQRRCKWK